MHKMLIVDDENIVRLALKSLIDWEKHGFTIEAEAANGRQALEALETGNNIDIVITDIKMPVMDGLEMISQIKKKGRRPHFVILSGYDDFALVRQAFKEGIEDYILKTEMNPEQVLKLMTGIKEKLELNENPQAKRKADLPASGHTVYEIRVMKEQLIKTMLTFRWLPEMAERLKELEVRLGRKQCTACCIWIDDYTNVYGRYEQDGVHTLVASVQNAIKLVLDEAGIGESVALSPQEYVLLLSLSSFGFQRARERIVDLLTKIQFALRQYVNVGVSIGVSEIKDGMDSFKPLYEQALQQVKFRFIMGHGKLIFPETIGRVGVETEHTGAIHELEAGLSAALKDTDEQAIYRFLDLWFDFVQREPFDLQKKYARYLNLVRLLLNTLQDAGGTLTDVFVGKKIDWYDEIKQFETCLEIKAWMLHLSLQISAICRSKESAKLNTVIVRSQKFIQNHFHEDLTLKMASDFVHLSESHFSAMFSKNVGMTFTDYLMRVRVEQAKKLLAETDLKIYVVAEKVGYANTEHFSRIFKKVTGYSPYQFKNNEY